MPVTIVKTKPIFRSNIAAVSQAPVTNSVFVPPPVSEQPVPVSTRRRGGCGCGR